MWQNEADKHRDNMSKTNILVVVTGPTASGKTELAVRLAEYFATDVISADSRQIYKDLPIGTAAPSTDERSQIGRAHV